VVHKKYFIGRKTVKKLRTFFCFETLVDRCPQHLFVPNGALKKVNTITVSLGERTLGKL
jgi:hypothetical protein